MKSLMVEIRQAIPFNIPEQELCSGTCVGCPKKLLEYLDNELGDWTQRLESGETPKLGDVNQVGKTAKKIHRALQKNNIV